MGQDKDKETSYQLPSRATQTQVREINILLIKRIRMIRNTNQSNKHLPPTPPFFLGSTSLLNSPPPPPQRCKWTGNGAWGQFITHCLCRSFLLTLLPYSSMGCHPQETILHNVLQCRASQWSAVLQEQTAQVWVSCGVTGATSKAASA